MELNIIIDYLIISIMASLAINSVLQNFAKQKKLLIDIPDRSRKFHKRATPLTGGIGILLAAMVSTEIYLDINNLKGYMPEFSLELYYASIPLLLIFLVDDFKALKPLLRLKIIFFLIFLFLQASLANDSKYIIDNIIINEEAESASEARKLANINANRQAFLKLLKNLKISESFSNYINN